MNRLQGKVALVTGAARGLGAAQAEALAKEGAKVIFSDLEDADGQKVEEATSKAAVRMLSKVTAAQQAHENIRCNSSHPGPTDGGKLHRFLPDPKALEGCLKRVPMGGLARVEEIVAGVIFLASDESSYMTGSELVIDGGALAQ